MTAAVARPPITTKAKDGDLRWSALVDDVPVSVSVAAGLVAVGGAEGAAWILNAATGQVRATTPALPGGLLHVALSPDGAHLAVTGPFGYALWYAADNTTDIRETGAWCSVARWADPDRLAVAAGRAAQVLDAAGTLLWQTEPMPSTVTDLAWHRDGRRLAASAYGGVYCFERHQNAPVTTYPYSGSHLALAIASTGRWITTGNQDATVHIWRARDGDELTMAGYSEKVTRLAFDPAGRYLANDGAADIITVWDFAGKGPDGTSPRVLAADQSTTALAWQPGTSSVLATGGAEGTLALWHPTTGRVGKAQQPVKGWELEAAATAVAWSGPGLLLAADRLGVITLRNT